MNWKCVVKHPAHRINFWKTKNELFEKKNKIKKNLKKAISLLDYLIIYIAVNDISNMNKLNWKFLSYNIKMKNWFGCSFMIKNIYVIKSYAYYYKPK